MHGPACSSSTFSLLAETERPQVTQITQIRNENFQLLDFWLNAFALILNLRNLRMFSTLGLAVGKELPERLAGQHLPLFPSRRPVEIFII